MGCFTVTLHATVLLHAATSVLAQFMPFPPQMPQMPQMPGMNVPQAVQTMQGGMPMGMPMGMSMGFQNMGMPQKMPMVVMPYHSKDQDKKRNKNRKKKKKRRPKKYMYRSESCSSEETSSDYTDTSNEKQSNRRQYMRSGHKSKDSNKYKKRREVLTPIISYVTKDGYVVYQKKVQKEKAKDWLEIGQKPTKSKWPENEDSGVGSEEKIKDEVKRSYRKIMKNRY